MSSPGLLRCCTARKIYSPQTHKASCINQQQNQGKYHYGSQFWLHKSLITIPAEQPKIAVDPNKKNNRRKAYGNNSNDIFYFFFHLIRISRKNILKKTSRNVILDKKFGSPAVTSDGVTIAKDIDLKDPYRSMGARMLKEAATKTHDLVGGGTATSTLLAQCIIREGLRMGSNLRHH